jgi:SdrD B-like protein
LTASGEPAGIKTALSTKFVTPVPNTPSSSTLSFTVGSSVTPQTFVETIGGSSSGIAGTLSHAAQVTVSVQATAGAIVNVINQDQALGCIDVSGIGQSLIAKLNAYQTLAAGGQLQGAANVLAAFQYETQAQTGVHISQTCLDPVGGNQFYTGQTLIADAQSLQTTLGAQVKANPIVGSVVSSSGSGISGATVDLVGPSKTIVATSTTDSVGFYYFGNTSGLTPGAGYTVTVSVAKGYKTSTPSAQTFIWSTSPVALGAFVLN